MIKGILFDLDGTILNTLIDLHDSINTTLMKYHMPLRLINETKNSIGNGIYNLIKESLNSNSDKDLINLVYHDYLIDYENNCLNKTFPYDGIISLLKDLNKQEFKLAVISNKKDKLVTKIVNHYFKNIFDYTIGDNDKLRIKPAPDMIIHTLEVLDLRKDEVIFIGDSVQDINASKKVDIKGIAVTWGYQTIEKLKSANPTYIIDKVSDIKVIIERINNELNTFR